MNCKSFQHALHNFLEGKLDAVVRLEAEAHIASCADCGELVRLAGMDTVEGAGADLVGGVLAQTSGPACARVDEIACDHVDGVLEPIDTDLLLPHLDECEGCTALVVALRGLAEDLPAMAELTPPVGFTESVLEATRPRPGRWDEIAARLTRAWESLVARPRIAWETGYVGAMAVWLIVSTVGAPFQASALLAPSGSAAPIVREVQQRVGAFGDRAWNATRAHGTDTWVRFRGDLSARYRHTEDARNGLRDGGSRLKDAALNLDAAEGARTIAHITRNANLVWQRFVEDPQPVEGTDTDTE